MDFDDFDDSDDADIISDGPVAVVTRIESESPDGPRLIAVKASTTVHAKEPHDIIKEARLLSLASHPNIIRLIKQELLRSQNLSIWMPYVPYSLDKVLRSSRFSPHSIISVGNTTSTSPTPCEVQFVILAKSIIFQILHGISYLHSKDIQIAHRDIKPSNVLLTASGCVQLIDFGVSMRVGEPASAKSRDLWPESTDRMYFEVSTGPYRAPELLFGARTYDAFAIDAWSLGITLSDFFTPLRLQTDEDEDEEFLGSESKSDSRSGSGGDAPMPLPTPFIIPRGTRGVPTGRWTRTSLFDASRGEIGLAWSIFKTRGTPNEHTWSSFSNLPDARKLSFADVEAVDLSNLLPNLPPSVSASVLSLDTKTHTPSADMVASPLDLVHRFLVYEPSRRCRASDALHHPWFTAEPKLVLPEDYDRPSTMMDVYHTFTLEGQTRSLKDLLRMHVARPGGAES